MRCILGGNYCGYENALKKPGLATLEERREQMCLKFAKQCLRLDKMKGLFPKNQSDHVMKKRNTEFYRVVKANTERFKRSSIPAMIRLLNDCQRKKKDTFNKLNAMPVNSVSSSQYHCDNNKQ